ncbi:MAG: ribonuclease P protein component [Cytophagales bacterium]|nr:ribonuclease P protein component [Cytophagales bacterium]
MFTLKKKERLSSYKLIKKLLDSSNIVLSSSVKCVFAKIDNYLNSKYHIQILIKTPKKKIKKATERNLIKRRIREIFRKNKHLLAPDEDQVILVQIEYLLTHNTSYHVLQQDILKAFNEISIKTS